MQKAGFSLTVHREDIRVFVKRGFPSTCVVGPGFRIAYSEESVTIKLIEVGNGVGVAFTAKSVAFPDSPNWPSRDLTHDAEGRSIQMKLEVLKASLEGRDPRTVGFEAIQ